MTSDNIISFPVKDFAATIIDRSYPEWAVTAAFRFLKYDDSPSETIEALTGECTWQQYLLFAKCLNKNYDSIKKLISKGIDL